MYKILGTDIAGRVEAVGRNVKQFQPGDEIWGDLSAYGWGAFAEYVCVPENALRLKPASMTFEEAAAVPVGGLEALHFLGGLNRDTYLSSYRKTRGQLKRVFKLKPKGRPKKKVKCCICNLNPSCPYYSCGSTAYFID